MAEWTETQWLMWGGGFILLGFLLLLLVVWLRGHFQRAVKNKILCEFIPRAGKAYKVLLPDKRDGTVEIPMKSKKNPGATYLVKEVVTYPIDYPEGLPHIVQAQANKAVFFEENFEPASNRSGMPVGSPKLLYNIIHEKFTQLGVEFAQVIDRIRGGGTFAANWITYVFYAVTIAALGYIGYTCYTNFDLIRAGLGV